MAQFNVENFRAQVSSGGLARENRFEVELPDINGSGRLVNLFCESATLPQLSVITKQQRLFGPPHVRAATIDYGGAGLHMVFFVDSSMKVKQYFDTWMHKAVNPSSFTVNYLKNYAKDIFIRQLDEQENIKYELKVIDAFPTSCGPISYSQASNDTFVRLPVTFSYRLWETKDITNTNTLLDAIFPNNAISIPWGPKISSDLQRNR